jgi:glycosyltransferase involved in cell wall biosynthesis
LVSGFDALIFPINHSDIDLCFKVRQLGLSCIYTPHAKLLHIGHDSLSKVESKKNQFDNIKDKADISLLKKWPKLMSRDPYFTQSMRELIYADSQEFFNIFLGVFELKKLNTKADILLITHDLSNSGAPKIALDIASLLHDEGYFVIVCSPIDGPMRHSFQKRGIDVIIDETCLTGSDNFYDFAKNFDLMLFNTIVTWRPILKLNNNSNFIWYLHETNYLKELIEKDPEIIWAIRKAPKILCGSELSKNLIDKINSRINIIPYGIDENFNLSTKTTSPETSKIIRIFGSYEPRKNQKALLIALGRLSLGTISDIKFEFYGRVLDVKYYNEMVEIAENLDFVSLHYDLEHEEYLRKIKKSLMVIVPSIDDSLPLVSLQALAYEIPLMCTSGVGTSAYIEDGISGYIIEDHQILSIEKKLKSVLASSNKYSWVTGNGYKVFEENFSIQTFKRKILKEVHQSLLNG